jgi:general secretion pathway protein G
MSRSDHVRQPIVKNITPASQAPDSLSRSSNFPRLAVLTELHCPPKRPAHHHRGFTLLELLVVMVIIGLLAGYVGPKLFAQIGKSETKVTRAQIDALQKALDQYRIDTGRYPSTEQGLATLVSRPADEPRWGGPYLAKAVPADPWGRGYVYLSPGHHGDYDLLSLGRDGQPGGEGEDADLTSW